MVKHIYYYQNHNEAHDPYRNLAIEKYLTLHARPGECILYLWQNRRSVVIGRNQNAWRECNVERLTADGGALVRRLSGGGAVFHDLGNLNFSFCAREEDYDVDRQLEVIRRGLLRLGIVCARSGRNDLLTDGRKFSGNAFYMRGGHCCHHGTIMIDVDRELLSRYLVVPSRKLVSKGITSVQSRVVNLKECRPDLTPELLAGALKEAFGEVYGLPAQEYPAHIQLSDTKNPAPDKVFPDLEEIRESAARFASREWIYEGPFPFTHEMEGQFDWGGVQLLLNVEKGQIADARIYSDAMDQDYIRELAAALKGCPYDKAALVQRAVQSTGPETQGLPEQAGLRRTMCDGFVALIDSEMS